MGGGGFLGSILTTEDSTFGGGLKLFFPTCRKDTLLETGQHRGQSTFHSTHLPPSYNRVVQCCHELTFVIYLYLYIEGNT